MLVLILVGLAGFVIGLAAMLGFLVMLGEPEVRPVQGVRRNFDHEISSVSGVTFR